MVKWNRESEYSNFYLYEDGVCAPDVWNNIEEKKILFILKEVDDPNNSFPGDFAKMTATCGNGWKTWARVAQWTDILLNNELTHADREYRIDGRGNLRSELFKHISIMNLSKFAGKGQTDGKYLIYAKKHIDLLEEQYNLINPDITVFCCGNPGIELLKQFIHYEDFTPIVFEKIPKQGFFRVYTKNEKTLIFMRHPQWNYCSSIWNEKLLGYLKSINK
ncbi:hypothetical protein [Treponema sp.]|uniref:hypothetical protein n=1 Tax=Treponema sp. TaxID=166 RepID=UPI00388D6037